MTAVAIAVGFGFVLGALATVAAVVMLAYASSLPPRHADRAEATWVAICTMLFAALIVAVVMAGAWQ